MRARSSSRRGSAGGTVLEIAESATDRPLDSHWPHGVLVWAWPGGASDALMNGATLTTARETEKRRLDHAVAHDQPAFDRVGGVHAHELEERRAGRRQAARSAPSVWNASVSPSSMLPRGLRFRIDLVRHGGVRGRPPARHRLRVQHFQAAPVFRPDGARDGNRLDDPHRRPRAAGCVSSCGRASRATSRGGGPRGSRYSRPMQFVAGFQEPFLSDALGLNVDGQLGRAWFLTISGGVARGSVGFNTGAPALRLVHHVGAPAPADRASVARRSGRASRRGSGSREPMPVGMTIPSRASSGRVFAPDCRGRPGCFGGDRGFRVTRTQIRHRRFSADRMARASG